VERARDVCAHAQVKRACDSVMPFPQVCDSIPLSLPLPIEEKHVFRTRYVVQVLAGRNFGVFLEHAILLQNSHCHVIATLFAPLTQRCSSMIACTHSSTRPKSQSFRCSSALAQVMFACGAI
jgi:hypothetical protein